MPTRWLRYSSGRSVPAIGSGVLRPTPPRTQVSADHGPGVAWLPRATPGPPASSRISAPSAPAANPRRSKRLGCPRLGRTDRRRIRAHAKLGRAQSRGPGLQGPEDDLNRRRLPRIETTAQLARRIEEREVRRSEAGQFEGAERQGLLRPVLEARAENPLLTAPDGAEVQGDRALFPGPGVGGSGASTTRVALGEQRSPGEGRQDQGGQGVPPEAAALGVGTGCLAHDVWNLPGTRTRSADPSPSLRSRILRPLLQPGEPPNKPRFFVYGESIPRAFPQRSNEAFYMSSKSTFQR